MNLELKERLRQRLDGLERMPSLPIVLAPLLSYLEGPSDKLEMDQVVHFISQDESLAAQCLQMANSPLFGRYQVIDNIHNAVVALGLQRMRDIAVSCSMLTMLPKQAGDIDPIVFWEHSLGCALVARQFARKVGYADPGKAYLAGLLHDIGIVAHLWVFPGEYASTLREASSQGIALHDAELSALGFTHCETGKMVAEKWHLAPDLVAVVSCHHAVLSSPNDRGLVSLVALSDLLCRMKGMGYGYVEERQVNFMEEPGFDVLLHECHGLQTLDWARFTFELEAYMEEVRRLVAVLYRPK